MFDVDLSLAKAMGHNAYRFSISWARLFPNQDMLSPDPAGVDYYRNILGFIKKTQKYTDSFFVSFFNARVVLV